nr:ATP-grasp domain-containing protein [Latilactobacillus curvatus]
MELVGTLGVEFFVGHDGQLYVNEIAPRPHNSGHLTIEACDFSQFATHIRASATGHSKYHNCGNQR